MMEREPLEVELLLSEDKRRVTVEDHEAFRRSLTADSDGDALDEAVAEESRKEAK